jgi:uncharacterized protein with von Willebrand factor type A (vWA) domain
MPLAARVAGFVSHLRLNGLAVGPAETATALRVLGEGELPALHTARERLKVLLTGRRSEWERFDDLFEAYWLAGGRSRTRSARRHRPGEPSRVTSNLWGERADDAVAGSRGGTQGWGHGQGGDGPEVEGVAREIRAASSRHVNTRADLRHVVDREAMAEAEAIAYRLARAMRYRLSRRHRVAARGRRIDLRRTIRSNLAHGGDPLMLVRRARPERPVRVVVMLDVSGSMQPYVRYLLQFVRGLAASWEATDAYLFNTRLTRITEVLREKDAILAMSRLALMAPGFGGGTRMSDCLATFNDQHAKRALDSRSVFVMLSDGYDTGEPDACVAELKRLKRRARKVVWLNPMLGWKGYTPATRTMRAALEHVDLFAPAHSLAALAALEETLRAL